MSDLTTGQLLEMALEYFAAVGIDVDVTDEGLTTGDGKVFGLEPLRRRLCQRDPAEWREAIRVHFETLLAVDPELPTTLAEAGPNLRSAVIAEADLGLFDGAIMERRLVDGLGERLMFRKGALGMTVRADIVEAWGDDPEAVWARARRGSLLDEPVEREEILLADPPSSFSSVRGGRWTSTWVVGLEALLPRPSRFGAIVAVPARDEILFHVIRDGSFAEATVAMLGLAASSYSESPLPIGCDLFWWSAGKLARICTPGESSYRYIRVPEFSRMLWELEETLGRHRPAHRLGRKTP